MIEVKNLTRSFGNLKVLKGIDLIIKKGEIVSIVGASGAGKTTLLQILGTIDKADNGFLRIGEIERNFESREFVKTGKFIRVLNWLIDRIPIFIISALLILIISVFLLPFNIFNKAVLYTLYVIIFFISGFLYYFLFEYKFHTTLGKLITNTIVVKNDGLYPDMDIIFTRTIMRFIPFEPISLLFSSGNRAWHDKISHTSVIEKRKNINYLRRLDSGNIKTDKDVCLFRNKSVGFVFQFHHLLPEFTAFENVCIPGFIAKRPRREVEKRAREILDFLNLGDRLDHKPNELSGGEQQRVAVARALINNPDVILADEPSGNLDSKNKEELHDLFFKLRDEFNQTFVIVTHDKDLATKADRMLTIKDGLIVNK